MDDYISRRDLLARYDAEHNGAPGRARELIEQAPAADVAPVVHAQWKDDTCTNCGYGVQPWNNTGYCPNCGAKMDKEDNT